MTAEEEKRIELLVHQLREAGVQHVIATMVDSGSITRVKCFSLDDLASFARWGSGFSILWALVQSNDHFTNTEAIRGPVGDMRMLPDTNVVVQLASTPEWAWTPMDFYDQEGNPLPVCPRGFLKRMIEAAKGEGYSLAWPSSSSGFWPPSCPMVGWSRFTEVPGTVQMPGRLRTASPRTCSRL